MLRTPLFEFIFTCFKQVKGWIAGQILVAIIWAIDLSFRPYLLKMIIDRLPALTPATAMQHLKGPASAFIGMALLLIPVFRFHEYVVMNIHLFLRKYIGDILMKRMMQHAPELFQNHFAGSLGNKIRDVMSAVPDVFCIFFDNFFSHFIALTLAVLTIGAINPKFGLALGFWALIFTVASFFFSKKAKELGHQAAEVRSRVSGQIVDILSNMMNVRLFARAPHESRELEGALDQYTAIYRLRDIYFMRMFAFQDFSFVVYQALCLFWLVLGFQKGQVTAGDFVLILNINLHLVSVLWNLSRDMTRFAESLGDISQGLNIALSPLGLPDKVGAVSLVLRQGEIIFEGVSFHYKKATPLFKEIYAHIRSGEKVGLVGYSGSGKTTFVNLILRLYDITGGCILIDGQDIREVTQESLRSAIAMIPQDPALFHRALKENIRYGRLEASDEEVIVAAKHAHAHDFISKLPEGYNSLVGERGVKLSGGQRQRIAIARAFLKNAPILILDEATSQLDSLTESDIQESLWELMQGKTVLVVAHRLSTLLHMDRILVFDQGKIVEEGPHQKLLARGGLYKTLWEAQVGGFLPDKKQE